MIGSIALGQTGVHLSRLGYGAAPLGGVGGVDAPSVSGAALERALEAGIAYFDTAPAYGLGRSELRVGNVLRERKRDSFSLSTKVGRVLDALPPPQASGEESLRKLNFRAEFDYSRDGIMRSVEQSMLRLGIVSFDILLIHDLDEKMHPDPEIRGAHRRDLLDRGGYEALQELRRTGVCKAIGAGLNRKASAIELIGETDLDVVLLAEPYNLLDQNGLEDFFPLCTRRGVPVILGGIYASGILVRGVAIGTYSYRPPPPAVVEKVRLLESVAGRHSIRLGDAAMQFALAHPSVISVIPGMRSPQEVDANVGSYHARIPSAFWLELLEMRLVHADSPLPEADAR
ncbi:MAG TPA: aldo/keto reductase [Devosiaceae bacterium]